MSDKKELKEEQLAKVSGGNDMDDVFRQAGQTAKEKEEERLKKLVEEAEKNREQRTNEELNNTVNNMIDILRKMAGTDDDSDGKIHIG